MKLSRTLWIILWILLIAILLVILWHYQYRYIEGLTNSNIMKNFYSVTNGPPPIETYVGEYTVLTFNSSCNITLPKNMTLYCGYIVVGGGSACVWSDVFDGGNGGGVCYAPLWAAQLVLMPETSYSIQVGAGGLNGLLAGAYDPSFTKTTNANIPKMFGQPSSISSKNMSGTIANGGYFVNNGKYTPAVTSSNGFYNLSGGVGDTFFNTASVVNGNWTNKPTIVNSLKNGPLISIPEINLKLNFGGGGGSGYTVGNAIGSDGGLGGGGTGNLSITDQIKIDGQPNSGGGGGGYIKRNVDSKGFWTSSTYRTGSGGSGVVIIYFMSPIASADKAFTVGSKVADEGGKFYLDSTTEVRYGYDNRWNYKTLAKGNYTANNDLFGDPAPGAGKIVQIISRENEIDKEAADKLADTIASAKQEQKLKDALRINQNIVAPTYSVPITEAFGVYTK